MKGGGGFWRPLGVVLIGVIIVLGMNNLLLYSQLSLTEEKYRSTVESLGRLSYSIDLLINYGNGSRVWYNGSRIPIGWSLFNATVLILGDRVRSTYYPEFKAHMVNSIDGVGDDPERKNWAWMLWHYNEASGKWETYDLGADFIVPRDGEKVAWHYQDVSKYPNLDPPA